MEPKKRCRISMLRAPHWVCPGRSDRVPLALEEGMDGTARSTATAVRFEPFGCVVTLIVDGTASPCVARIRSGTLECRSGSMATRHAGLCGTVLYLGPVAPGTYEAEAALVTDGLCRRAEARGEATVTVTSEGTLHIDVRGAEAVGGYHLRAQCAPLRRSTHVMPRSAA